MNGMCVSFREIDDIVVAKLLGQEITYEVGETLQSKLRSGPEAKPPAFVLDLSSLTFLGSIGLTVLVVFLKRVKTTGGHLVIAGLGGQCRNVMNVMNLDKAFDLFDDLDVAIAAIQAAE